MLSIGGALLLAANLSQAQAAQATTARLTHGGTTTWHLNQSVLDSLGVHVTDVKHNVPSPASPKHGSYKNLQFAALDASALRFRESRGLPRAFSGGALQHGGGFVL